MKLHEATAIGANPIDKVNQNPLAIRADYPQKRALQRDLTRYYEEALKSGAARRYTGQRRKEYAAGVAWRRVHEAGRFSDYFEANMAAKKKKKAKAKGGGTSAKGGGGKGGGRRGGARRPKGGGKGGGHHDTMVIALNPAHFKPGQHPRGQGGQFLQTTGAGGHPKPKHGGGGGHSTKAMETIVIKRNPTHVVGTWLAIGAVGALTYGLIDLADRYIATRAPEGSDTALTGDEAAKAIKKLSWGRIGIEGLVGLGGLGGGMFVKRGLGRSLLLAGGAAATLKTGVDLFGKWLVPMLMKDTDLGKRLFPAELSSYADYEASSKTGQTPGVNKPDRRLAGKSGTVGCGACGGPDASCCSCQQGALTELTNKLNKLRQNAACPPGCATGGGGGGTTTTTTQNGGGGGGGGSMTPGGGGIPTNAGGGGTRSMLPQGGGGGATISAQDQLANLIRVRMRYAQKAA